MRSLYYTAAFSLVFGAFAATAPVQAGPALYAALHMNCARNVCTIKNNPGGEVNLFQAAAREVMMEGKRLVIDGFCASACVLLADYARSNTCLTKNAQLAVHKATVVEMGGMRFGGYPGGRVVRREDPPQSPDVDKWVKDHGGYPTKGVKIIPVKEANKFWKMC